jgi:hypothetical protein
VRPCLLADGSVDARVLAHGIGYFLGDHFQGIVAHGLHGGPSAQMKGELAKTPT